jgi:peptidoglycan/LPS O-acetylase OafA/YrhL
MISLLRISPGKAGHADYRADIDGLRALAVLAVVLFHFEPTRLQGGFVGVDVFFVISGYLISSQLASELRQGTFSYVGFYKRRIRRIFPALILVMAAVLMAGWLLLLPQEYAQLGKHIVAGSLFVSNIVLWTEAGYFDITSSGKPLLHLWSLGVEEQFYIVWPVVLALLWRAGRLQTRWLVMGCLASLAVCWWLSTSDPSGAFFLPWARFWQPMTGAVVAMLLISGRVRVGSTGALHHAGSVLGLVLIVGTTLFVDEQSAYPWMRAALPTLGAALIIAAGPGALLNRQVLSRRVFVLIGLISYPLYLWHWPLLSFLDIVAPPGPTRAYKLLAVLLSFLLATATYLFVEKPIRTPPVARVRWLIVGSMVCLMAGASVVLTDGFLEARGPWGVRADVASPATEDMQTGTCVTRHEKLFQPGLLPRRDFCVDNGEAATDVLVIGDSHANRLFAGLLAQGNTKRIMNLGRGTCVPLLGYEGQWSQSSESLDCRATTQSLLEFAGNSGAQKVVIHGFFIRAFGGGMVMTGSGDLHEQARRTLLALSASGVDTILVLDVPWLPFEPASCVARPALKHLVRSPCSFPRAAWHAQSADTNAALVRASVGLERVRVFDPANVLCDATDCHAAAGGELLYMDSHHLSPKGASLVGKALLSELSRAFPANR